MFEFERTFSRNDWFMNNFRTKSWFNSKLFDFFLGFNANLPGKSFFFFKLFHKILVKAYFSRKSKLSAFWSIFFFPDTLARTPNCRTYEAYFSRTSCLKVAIFSRQSRLKSKFFDFWKNIFFGWTFNCLKSEVPFFPRKSQPRHISPENRRWTPNCLILMHYSSRKPGF